MIDGLTIGLIAASLLIAVFSVVTAVRNRPMSMVHVGLLALLEIGLLVQAGVGVATVLGGDGPEASATFVGYLIGAAVIPIAAGFWGFVERSRWGPAVIAVACFVVPVLIGRLEQMWTGTA
ncbi:hypothetical protein [Rhizohabitans arisaemae]|uniref:hypothetical protein n=1 Tax=Rhizohabitans arisaemae TaxID=2720610 RepID=UPI0024B10B61|nr:hypothetical protein [Rhizohabitans arisaemae]